MIQSSRDRAFREALVRISDRTTRKAVKAARPPKTPQRLEVYFPPAPVDDGASGSPAVPVAIYLTPRVSAQTYSWDRRSRYDLVSLNVVNDSAENGSFSPGGKGSIQFGEIDRTGVVDTVWLNRRGQGPTEDDMV